MPTRRLPQSTAATLNALQTAKLKNDALAPGDRFLTTPTQTRLDAILGLLGPAISASGVALANQSASTTEVENAKILAHMFMSHYYQVFNLGVARGKYPKAHRAFYNLDVNSDKLPAMSTEADIILQGERIALGDSSRITAGGAAMANPSAAEVLTVFTDFATKNLTQSGLKDAYDTALETIAALMPEAHAVVKKIWDEVETFYNEETPSSMRRKAREWGVFYESDVLTTMNMLLRDSATLAPLGAVHLEILETGLERDSIADGTAKLTTKASDGVTVRCTHADYVTQDVDVEFIAGTLTYSITVNLVHI